MMNDLDRFMAAIRFSESGDWQGDYNRTRRIPGDRLVGAYGFLESKWAGLAQQAGVPGADWRTPAAQDYVAGQLLNQLHSQYGSWDLAAAAWYGGTRSANNILFKGFSTADDIQNPQIREYAKAVVHNAERAPQDLPQLSPMDLRKLGSDWLFPVAGENKWNDNDFGIYAKGRVHQGVDIHAKRGTAIVAPVSGKINFSKGGLEKSGEAVRLVGDDGIEYWFAHLDSRGVERGQRVEAGYVIGTVGNSGNARTTGPHLHLEMKLDGRKIDPAPFLQGGNSMPGAMPLTMGDQPKGTIQDKADRRLRGLFDAVSSYMAGGTRVDYRNVESEVELTEEDTDMQAAGLPEGAI